MPNRIENIVITGAAMISPLGLTRQQSWEAVKRGQCGMGTMTAMEQPLPGGRDGGQVPDLPGDADAATPREVRYLRQTFKDALADAGIDPVALPYPSHRCGILIGTTLHGMRAGGQFLRSGDFTHLRNFLAGHTLRATSQELGFEGPAVTTCSACSSSLGAIALAVTLLQSGQFDLILAGGYDPISEYAYAGFNSLRLVAGGPLRPFTRNREGMKLAEGYAIVALERETLARARGAKPLAQILGFGESADAHHLTQPHPQGEGAARAMSDALAAANLKPSDIGLIAAHATGTPDNDAAEFAAMSRVFGDALPQIPVVAFKSHLGHTLGGAGAVELILSAMALDEQVVPPCANVCADEIEFPGLNLTAGKAKRADIRATLNTSLGFGGANTCVVLTRASTPLAVRPASQLREVYVTGIGVVLPGAIGNDAFIKRMRDASPPVEQDCSQIPETEFAHLLNARRVRRMSDYVKYSLASTALAFADAGISDIAGFGETCAGILGTMHGSATYCCDYYGQVVREGIAAANPMLFAEGVPNAAAAHLSLMMSLKGACQTIIGTRTAGLDALRLAAARIAQGQWDRVVVSAGEGFCETVNNAYTHCGMRHPNGFSIGCGAITFILESGESAPKRNAPVRGRIVGGASATPGNGRRESGFAHIMKMLDNPPAVIGSANGTWIDRMESAGMREHGEFFETGHPFAETFSVTPLINVAAVLLGAGLRRDIAALSTDFTGAVSAVRIRAE